MKLNFAQACAQGSWRYGRRELPLIILWEGRLCCMLFLFGCNAVAVMLLCCCYDVAIVGGAMLLPVAKSIQVRFCTSVVTVVTLNCQKIYLFNVSLALLPHQT